MRTLVLAALLLAAPACTADKPGAPQPPSAPAASTAAPAAAAGRTAEIKVTEAGFEPSVVKARAGEPITLVFTRVTDRTCVTAIDIPDEKVKGFELPLDRPVSLTITPQKPGVKAFHCSAMGMGGGRIVVE
jgi:plastocyanin domain-containing protein